MFGRRLPVAMLTAAVALTGVLLLVGCGGGGTDEPQNAEERDEALLHCAQTSATFLSPLCTEYLEKTCGENGEFSDSFCNSKEVKEAEAAIVEYEKAKPQREREIAEAKAKVKAENRRFNREEKRKEKREERQAEKRAEKREAAGVRQKQGGYDAVDGEILSFTSTVPLESLGSDVSEFTVEEIYVNVISPGVDEGAVDAEVPPSERNKVSNLVLNGSLAEGDPIKVEPRGDDDDEWVIVPFVSK